MACCVKWGGSARYELGINQRKNFIRKRINIISWVYAVLDRQSTEEI